MCTCCVFLGKGRISRKKYEGIFVNNRQKVTLDARVGTKFRAAKLLAVGLVTPVILALTPYGAGAQESIAADSDGYVPTSYVCGSGYVGYYSWYNDGYTTYGEIIIDPCLINSFGGGPADYDRILAHEQGHARGLPHSLDPNDVMYAYHTFSVPVVEAPVVEVPVVEVPVVEVPVVEVPVVEPQMQQAPVIETPVIETPVIETSGVQQDQATAQTDAQDAALAAAQDMAEAFNKSEAEDQAEPENQAEAVDQAEADDQAETSEREGGSNEDEAQGFFARLIEFFYNLFS